jgi:hypothetical protein
MVSEDGYIMKVYKIKTVLSTVYSLHVGACSFQKYFASFSLNKKNTTFLLLLINNTLTIPVF